MQTLQTVAVQSHRFGRLTTRGWVLLAVMLGAAACGSPAGGSVSSAPTGAASTQSTGVATTTTTEQPGWTAVGYNGPNIAIDERSVTTPSGAHVELVRFRAGQVNFALHIGSTDPPHAGIVVPAGAGSAVTAAEQSTMLGAFNGGFLASTGSGGVEVNGTVLTPLIAGAASLVIDTNGTAHVGAWGTQLPIPGEQVASVRQNLTPLVNGSQPSSDVGLISAWGQTLGGGSAVARSALGEDAAGNIIYAGSMSALPTDMANALVQAGATTGMELDINPEWVQADVAQNPGAQLVAAVPGQQRPANQYITGWTRDFIVVSAAG